jgi:hypothetical protein
MVLTVSFALSPVIGLFFTVTPEKLASQELDAGVEASGPHDFAVRYQRRSSKALPASTASRPTSVTIASAPHEERDGEVMKVICVKREAEYFCGGGWTGWSVICPPGSRGARLPLSASAASRPKYVMITSTLQSVSVSICILKAFNPILPQ